MDKKLMLIVNPAAGKGEYKYNFSETLKLLSDFGYLTTLYFTKARGDAIEYAEKYASGYDVVVCIGGDGTLSEVMSGLMKIDNPPPLGYFPMGTANDVATTVDLPKNDSLGAAVKFVKGTPHPFDVGGFGPDRYFAYVAAFGAFTAVSYETPQDQKKILGHLAYVLQGAASLKNIEAVHAVVEYDDGVVEGNFVYGSMTNSTSVAGIVRLPGDMVSLGDGVSELVLVKEPKSIEEFNEMFQSVITKKFDSRNLLFLHTKKAKFTFDKPVAWTRDGEPGGVVMEIELCNYHSPVQLIF